MIFMEVTYEQTGHGNGRDRRRPYPLRPGERADIIAAEGTYRRQGGGISSRAPATRRRAGDGARPAYESAVQGQIGDVQVHFAAQELADGEVDSWALFEVQDVVYEVLTANDADAELRTWVLQELLGEN